MAMLLPVLIMHVCKWCSCCRLRIGQLSCHTLAKLKLLEVRNYYYYYYYSYCRIVFQRMTVCGVIQ